MTFLTFVFVFSCFGVELTEVVVVVVTVLGTAGSEVLSGGGGRWVLWGEDEGDEDDMVLVCWGREAIDEAETEKQKITLNSSFSIIPQGIIYFCYIIFGILFNFASI